MGVTKMKQIIFAAIVAILTSACTTPATQTSPHDSQIVKSGYALINGIKMYYEIHGSAGGSVPLVLLNGGGSTINVPYSRVLPIFSSHRMVIALEEQGHGRTSDRKEPFRAETSADDVSALLKYLKVAQADVMGFSNGAGVAMEVAIRHPEQVRKLVFAAYFTKKSGAQPWFWDFMKKADFAGMPQPLKDAFLKVNPDEEALKNMCLKDIERMQHFKEIPDKDVKSIRAPTLIMVGDKDVVKPEHAIELNHMIANSRLIILPGTHGEFLGEILGAKPGSHVPEYTAGLVEEFLNQ
jgi:pimeloyl-ACP methyl ester carboxylesterase